MRLAIMAAAKLADIKMDEAEASNRRHPLFNEEIHIEEELINLEEAISSYHVAAETLVKYPSMRRHILIERRQILKHCIGLISRMEKGKILPRQYNEKDTEAAVRKLINLIVEDARKANYRIDARFMKAFKPYLNKYLVFRDWAERSFESLRRRFVTLRKLSLKAAISVK